MNQSLLHLINLQRVQALRIVTHYSPDDRSTLRLLAIKFLKTHGVKPYDMPTPPTSDN